MRVDPDARDNVAAETTTASAAATPRVRVRPQDGVIGPLFRMLVFAKPYLLLIGLAGLFNLLFSGGRYGRALLLKPVLDDVLLPAQAGDTSALSFEQFFTISASGPTTLQWIVLAGIGIVFVMPIASFAKGYLQAYALGSISRDVKKTIAQKLLSLPLAFHQGTSSGDTLSRALNDAHQAEQVLHLVLSDFLLAAAMMTMGIASLFFISCQVSIVSLLSAPAIVWVLGVFSVRI